MDASRGPYINAAFICREAVGPPDRDAWRFTEPLTEIVVDDPARYLKFWYVVMLEPGDAIGPCDIQIFITVPSGERFPYLAEPYRITLDGPGPIVPLVEWIRIPLAHEGRAWLDLVIDGVLKSRTSLRVYLVAEHHQHGL